jgi:calpain-7
MTTTARNEFWPAIIEKAILKLYNCRNLQIQSNPSCEIFHLSGWIPEAIKFSEISDKMQLFTKIRQNFEDGNVLLCLGLNENAFFPVIGFREKDNQHMLKVILASPTLMVKDQKTYSELVTPASTSAIGEDTGVKWLDWISMIITKFDTLYLSWNPSIYSHRFIFDSVWYKGPKDSLFWNEEYSLEYNPQFLIHLPPHQSNLEVTIPFNP